MPSRRSKTRLSAQARRSGDRGGRGKLILNLKDMNGQPIATRSTIVVASAGAGSLHYEAKGKEKATTRFTFELPTGEYSVRVKCQGFENSNLLLTIRDRETHSHDVTLNWRIAKSKGEDETKVLEGRFKEFVKRRSLASGEFSASGRDRALEQKRRMLDPEVTNSMLNVKPIPDPVPRSSFGNIGSFVEVNAKNRKKPFQRSILKIPYSRGKLGWVSPATLRVFKVDPMRRQFQLIEQSGADPEKGYAYGYINRPGVYGVIGLPLNPALLETIRVFCKLQPPPGTGGPGSLQDRICQLILCAQERGQLSAEGFTPPGGVAGNVCDFCTSLDLPSGGLPECQILAGPPPPPTGTCSWLSVGPRNINGRIRALAIHPNDGNTVFAGTANAGVWKTTDGGVSWMPLMFQEGALEIGALAVHLTDPGNPAGPVTVYAGTGEPTSWPGYKGVGVLKSTASGAPGTWMTTGAIASPGGDRFATIAIDPSSVTANPTTTVVYAGGPGGLFKSTNGGGAWALALNKNVQSLVLDPTNPQVIYVGAAFEGVFKFDPVTSTWSAFNTGLVGPFPQLIAVDIGKTAPHKMYAKLDETVYVYNTVTNMWQSLGNHGGTTYGYWNNVLAVDPQDSNIVFAAGFAVERTYDGGTMWQAPAVGHVDNHAIVFDTTNHLNAYVGNDGGVFRGTYSSQSDTGTWTKQSDGMTISHLNSLGVSPTAGPDVLGCGVQDNGTIRTTGGLTWDSLPIGGDGSAFIVDPANPLILYGQLTTVGINSRPYKSTDGGASFNLANTGFPDGPFVGKMVLDPNSPPEPNRVLFIAGTAAVYRSANSAGSWSQSSPVLVGTPTALAVAPSSSAMVYAGSDAGKVWRNSDGGATMAKWKDVTVGTIAGSATLPARSISDIVIHPTDPDTVFVCFQRFNDITPGHVFKGTSTDGWTTWGWQDITSNLPDIPVNAMEIHRTTPNTLWVGTDTGVFQTVDGGISWAPFDNGLPNVVIVDLALNAAADRLRAAAYGYSLWEIPLGPTCVQEDIYVRDNKLDTGEDTALSGVPDPTVVGGIVNWWESVDIKVDAYPYYTPPPDGVEFDHAMHENPVRNDAGHPDPNRLYVQVHNRGPQATNNVKVKVLWADASAGLPPLPSDFWSTYPNAWAAASSWAPIDPAVAFQNILKLLPHTPKILVWNWVVPTSAATHSCVLCVISSDEDPVSHSDSNPNDHLVWMVAPADKHIALKNMDVVTAAPPPPGGGVPGGVGPAGADLEFHNPLAFAEYFDILFDRGTLPKEGRVSLLLPAFQSRSRLIGKLADVPVVPTSPKSWWRSVSISKKAWKHEFRLSDGVAKDPCTGIALAAIPGVLIPARKALRGAVVIELRRGRPGAVYRCSVQQRLGNLITGGNTYEVRIPPIEVIIKQSSK